MGCVSVNVVAAGYHTQTQVVHRGYNKVRIAAANFDRFAHRVSEKRAVINYAAPISVRIQNADNVSI